MLYYNSFAGEWEPLVESLHMKANIFDDKNTKKYITTVELPDEININLTENFMMTYFETMNAWERGLE